MQITEGFWGFVIIAGPLVLALVMAFALLRNRKRTPRQEARTEAATRAGYEDATADRHRRGE
jgi:uncharacterized protein YpmB